MTVASVFAACLVAAVAIRVRPPPARVAVTRAEHGSAGSPSALGRVLLRRRTALVALAIVGTVTAAATGPALVVATGGAALVWWRLRMAFRARRAAIRMQTALPDFVDMLVLTVRAGHTPMHAFDELQRWVDPVLREPLAATIERVRRGVRFADALHEFAIRTGVVGASLASALALADRYGNPLPPVLDRLSAEARASRRRQAEAAARRLPILLSFPLVLCTLPSFVLLTIVPLMAGTLSSLRGFAS